MLKGYQPSSFRVIQNLFMDSSFSSQHIPTKHNTIVFNFILLTNCNIIYRVNTMEKGQILVKLISKYSVIFTVVIFQFLDSFQS